MALAIAPTPMASARRKPRLKATPKPFTLAHFRRWASDLILDTGDSWHPEAFQDAMVEDLFAGFAECWYVIPEGNTKTTTFAGIALYHAEFRPFAVVPVAAASREQAEILYRQAEGFVLRSELLHRTMPSAIAAAKGKLKTDVPRFLCLEGYRRINHYGGGRIQIFAADDRTGDGIIPTLGMIDEPHRLPNLRLYRTWAGKLSKRDGQLATISTAGDPGSEFEETRARIKDQAENVTRRGSFARYAGKRLVLHEWALAPGADPEDMAAVKAANPFSSITVETLTEKRASPTMTLSHWRRFVCNVPTRDIENWLGPNGDALWRSLTEPYAFRPGVATYAGVDMALRGDTASVVLIQKRDDGRYHATCRIWTPSPAHDIDVTDVMHHLREAAKLYRIVAVSYDPKYFDLAAKMLSGGGLNMVEVPQSIERMTPIVGAVYAALQRGQITHDGDEAFTRQVLNAVPRFNERAFTLEKSKSHGKIDAAIALSLAFDQALRFEDKPKPALWVGAA